MVVLIRVPPLSFNQLFCLCAGNSGWHIKAPGSCFGPSQSISNAQASQRAKGSGPTCTVHVLLRARDQRSEHGFDGFRSYHTLYGLLFPTYQFFQLAKQLWKPGVIQLSEVPPAFLGITSSVTEPAWISGMFSIHFSAKSDTSAHVPWVHRAHCWTLFRSCRRACIVCTQAFFTKVTRIWQQPLSEAGKLLQPLLHRRSGENVWIQWRPRSLSGFLLQLCRSSTLPAVGWQRATIEDKFPLGTQQSRKQGRR